ncbi:TlpA family protein disulfide reductase [Flavivirga spongiicola]|uniref:TlpA family protein disulfide reductase n=1 Tax=Flavivirga spongiicola TaxID=421621 RepID=A0ABU7XY00_9FLAO|nr:TlpA disulfide reductase family protein [Flavivirga sp. MEBiC05379]MDO5980647.1 TlpA disulfide reductase family protein [Flavivirga sp. MEBiC05379]
MKKTLVLLSALTIVACKEEPPKDYATLSGKITNLSEDKLIKIQSRNGFKKEIAINDDGIFNDTLKVEAGDYYFSYGEHYGQIFLKNDNETSFSVNTENFKESLKFSGDAANKNNFFVEKSLLQDKYLTEDIMYKSEIEFEKAFSDLKNAYTELKESHKDLDSTLLNRLDKDYEGTYKGYKTFHNNKLAILKAFPKGSPSPVFNSYENFKGGTTSLSDLKGKYVYVDVWATWCGPCKREIPFLKEVEEKYHGKNIEFVSISVDDGRGFQGDTKELKASAAKEGWKKMVTDKELGGVQLIADKGFLSDFVQGYKINGIPRFILIDTTGNVLDPDAPRPSSPKLIELFTSLNI